MKISNDRLFPYPVLKEDNENFSSSKFKAEVEYRHNEIEYEFDLTITLNEDNLIDLLKKGKVSILCHLECSKTKFRNIKELKIGKNEFRINVDSLEGKLDLVVFIVTNEDLKDYHSKNFDSDYKGNHFIIEKKSILGIAEIPSVIIENKKENTSNLPSIFDVHQSPAFDKFMKVGLNSERILIYLPIEEYKIRNAHKNSIHSRNIMNTMIVLPALIGVLNYLQDEEAVAMYGGKRWFSVINKKLKNCDCDIEAGDLDNADLFSLAQKLLEELFSDAMDSLNYLEDSEK